MASERPADVDTNRLDTLDVPELRHKKKWWFQDPGLRKLYFLIFIAILSSATNGYDGFVLRLSLSLNLYWHWQVNDEWTASFDLLENL